MTTISFSTAEPMEGDQELPFEEPEQYVAHPVANLFPMQDADEFAELVDSMKTHGFRPEYAILLDKDGRILDGRNRYAAAQEAGVQPVFTTFDGDDPAGFAYKSNMARRNLDKGQRAMLAVTARPLLSKGIDLAGDAEVSAARISQARAVAAHAPALGDLVIAKKMSLNDAYAEAKERKRLAEEIASKRALLEDRPDLLDLVDREKLKLDAAIAARQSDIDAAEREEREKRNEAEAARIAAEQDELDAIARHKTRIESVVSGWPTVREYVLSKPDDGRTKKILAALGETTRQALEAILQEIGE